MKIFQAIKINGVLEFFGKYKEFVDELKDGQNVEFQVLTDKEYRTSQHNRYMWGYTYRPFCPDYFQDVNAVHEFYTRLYLTHQEVIDFTKENFIEIINDIKDKARLILPYKKQGDKVVFSWVQSTASLSPKGLGNYISQVQLSGNERGIDFIEFDKNKHY